MEDSKVVTISALCRFSREIIDKGQYSFLAAVAPTLIAGLFFLRQHLLPDIGKTRYEKYGGSHPSEEG
jgi:hypothetical protein